MRVLRRRFLVRLIPPFGHSSHSHNICPLDNHLSGLSISLSSLARSWVYRLPFFKSLVWLGCDSNSQPSVLVASTLPLHKQAARNIFPIYTDISSIIWSKIYSSIPSATVCIIAVSASYRVRLIPCPLNTVSAKYRVR